MNLTIDINTTKEKDVEYYMGDFPVVYIGKGTYSGPIGLHSYRGIDKENECHLVYIGRYVSMADNVQIYCDMNHDYNSVYMGIIDAFKDDNAPTYRASKGQADKFMKHKGMVVIGNDVWIGDNVTINAGVVIGNGAVIASESIVTRDVPPYTIYGGNPAVKIKDRFPEDVAQKLQSIAWWELPDDRLVAMKEDMQGDVRAFAEKYYPGAGCDSSADKRSDGKTVVLFIDVESDFPSFPNAIEWYWESGKDKGYTLKVCVGSDVNEEKRSQLKPLFDDLRQAYGLDPVYVDETEEAELIKGADYLILGRGTKFLHRIDLAMRYGTGIVSGVDSPLEFA